jgi:glyoxylase-like metal-dependent hydrolase (beta-lactamase superfamily II)
VSPAAALPVAPDWFSITQIEPGLHRITEPHCDRLIRANAYLVEGSERDLLVDTGMGIGPLRAALAGLRRRPLIVFATHTHVDHMGGHREFRDCELLVHPAEAADMRHPPVPKGLSFDHFEAEQRATLRAAGFDVDGLLVDAVPEPGYDVDAYVCEGVEPTRLVDEGDAVDLGSRRFDVLHLPGHSPGGLGLWEAATGTLIAGDTLYDGVLIDTITGADVAAYVRSMRRLRDLPARIVHGGHRDSFGRARMIDLIDSYLADRAAT